MSSNRPATLALIAGVARDGAIGRDNQLLWRLPEDMAFFRERTLGCPVIMGRRTWESLPAKFRPLPGRRNIVVTRQRDYRADGAEVVHGLDEALQCAADAPRAWVIGGAELYALALPLADELVLTEIEHDWPDADAHFPPWDRSRFEVVSQVRREVEPPRPFAFAWTTYRRKTGGGS